MTINNYKKQEEVHFDWLNTISFQLNLFSSTSSALNSNSSQDSKEIENPKPIGELRKSINKPAPIIVSPKENTDNEQISLASTKTIQQGSHLPVQSSPCFATQNLNSSTMRFVCDDSLLASSSSDDDISIDDNDDENDSPPNSPFTLGGSLKELTQSAYSFREAWKEMCIEKKQESTPRKKSFKFAFEDIEEPAEVYQMSDDCEDDDEFDDDEEMYERNPIEIHGKSIPNWARGEQLEKQLKKQYLIDPDEIFFDFPMECNLEEIFGTQNQKWAKRNESGYWAQDGVTQEEIRNYSSARFQNINGNDS
ncbi:hypothetical protein TVAG_079220 [Trichomonas vaginalis G3]|uniref:Inner centromere protein ARK-binding domain-containing protein n=1 Tax=Trichomonas vaginalis (strain ATCC PRA-98 / G3) TaxID=412133 RepID=A2EF54_TRIV3|nr:inner centromere protein, ARK binding region-containing protein [Trichomonas vaginalis G3]EAY08664.1 hypothetical protein TVAG_079220 [Trichomonas vaginalis G3]KAI5492782.1 inner centromere protein, ARK binding region-containing protein [Trichomonas vaginalis G3]|eukprot:XP_001320887.1 hypothetical protein [Trichomonas vaginalis G3]